MRILMNSAFLYIISGTILVAVGGIMLTYGWSLHTSNKARERAEAERPEKRAAMLRTLAAEFEVNTKIASDPQLREKDPKKLNERIALPKLQVAGLQSAISSGLFDGDEDSELFSSILGLREAVSEFNDSMDMTETLTMNSKGHMAEFRKKLRDGVALASLRKRLAEFEQVLARYGYGINRDDDDE